MSFETSRHLKLMFSALQWKSQLCILFWELLGLSPHIHIHESRSDLFIPRISPHISRSRIGRSMVGIYKPLTYTWMWSLGLWPRNSFSGNIYFKFFRYGFLQFVLNSWRRDWAGGGEYSPSVTLPFWTDMTTTQSKKTTRKGCRCTLVIFTFHNHLGRECPCFLLQRQICIWTCFDLHCQISVDPFSCLIYTERKWRRLWYSWRTLCPWRPARLSGGTRKMARNIWTRKKHRQIIC